MNSFRNNRLRNFSVPMSTNWLHIDLAEAKGKQERYERWHDGPHDLLPWLNHLLAIADRAYGEFEQHAGDLKSPRGAKTELVANTIETNVGEFGRNDLERACPAISRLRLRYLTVAKMCIRDRDHPDPIYQ